MLSLRREYAQLVTSGAQLFLIFIAFKLDSRLGSGVVMLVMAVVSLVAWQSALGRLRAVRDMPTSKIASAAQGYVELVGKGRPYGDLPVYSKRRLPCLWYRYTVEELDSDRKWQTVGSDESSTSFILRDATGDCVVDLDHAEIMSKHKDQWREGDQRITEWKFILNDDMYVIGDFRTHGGVTAEFDTRAEMSALLSEWKKDMPKLHKRFDLNNDGELDMNEWMLARQAAGREVEQQKREVQAFPDSHSIRAPQDGKLYLISNLSIDSLAGRYQFWTGAHLAIFFGGLAAAGWLLR